MYWIYYRKRFMDVRFICLTEMKKHKHEFYMDRGTCFCKIKGCGAFHTICYEEVDNFDSLKDTHLQKNNEVVKKVTIV